MLLSVKTCIYRQIINLIQASGALYDPTAQALNLLKPGTLIRVDQPVVDPRKKNAQAADFPQLLVGYAAWNYMDDSSIGGGRGRPGGLYGDQLVAVPPMKLIGRPKTLTLGFQLTMTHRDLQALVDDPLEIALIEAIEANGPNLGIPQAVIPLTQLSDINVRTQPIVARDSITPQMHNVRRAESTFAFNVLARWHSNAAPTQNT